MSELTPITRVESYLDAIVNNGIPPTEDITRIETFLQAIYDNQVCALTPITRIEMFLGKISGQSLTLPEPVTRVELYLAAIAGEDVELPENPITRLEMYLAEWADSGDWTTISGAIVEFITQRAHKLKSCVVSLSPKQDLSHGDPSPTNICPISGWTGCEVTRTGKNLIDPAKRYNYQANTHRWYTTDGFVLKANQTYTLSSYPTAAQVYFLVASADATLATGFVKCTYTPAEDTTVCFQLYSSSGASGFELQLELGSTATDYEPYQGEEVSVIWEDEAGTVYGGTVDLVSGVLTVEWVSVDASTLSFILKNNTANRQAWEAIVNDLKPVSAANSKPNALLSEFKLVSFNDAWMPYCVAPNYTGTAEYPNLVFCFPTSAYTSEAEVKTALVGVQLVYELANPTTIQLTPQQVTALKGYNAMWSDAQSIEVTVHGTPVEVSTPQALNMLLGGAYRNNQTADDVSDDEALDIILGGDNK